MPSNRRRWLCAALALITAACRTAKPPEPRTIAERQLSLTDAQAEVLSFELREGSQLRIEAVHVSGGEVSVLLLDKDGLARFRTTQRITAYPALSRADFADRFDSGWHALPPAVYSLVAVQQKTNKNAPVPSVLNLRVYTR